MTIPSKPTVSPRSLLQGRSEDDRPTSAARRWNRFALRGLIILIIATVGLAAYSAFPANYSTGVFQQFLPQERHEAVLTAVVRRVTMPITISASGELASADAVEVICEVEGQAAPKIIEMLPEGTVVKIGDVVMQLDPSQIKENLAQQQIKVAQTEGLARAVAEDVKIQQNMGDSQIAQAELAVKLATLDKEKYIQGEYEAEMNDLQGLIALSESELEDAHAELEHFRDLVKKGFSTPEQLRSKEQAVKRAEHNLRRDQERLNVLQKYTRERQVVELEAKAEEAHRELERAKSSAAAAIAKAETDLEVARATAELERRQLERIESQLVLCTVRAPSAGTVIYEKEKDISIELGAEVRYKQKLFSLPSSSQMKVNAFVNESLVKQVEPGMKAEIRIDAFPGLPLSGEIADVAAYYDSTRHWLTGGVKDYATVVSVEGSTGNTIRSGMSAEVRIHVADLSDSLVVPLSTVTEQDGQHYCFSVLGDRVEPRRVSIGIVTEEFAEILDGLEEGELVALDARRRLGAGIEGAE